MIKTTHHFKTMIDKSYPPGPKDKFIVCNNNTLGDCINIPMGVKPTKMKNRSGYWRIKNDKRV